MQYSTGKHDNLLAASPIIIINETNVKIIFKFLMEGKAEAHSRKLQAKSYLPYKEGGVMLRLTAIELLISYNTKKLRTARQWLQFSDNPK